MDSSDRPSNQPIVLPDMEREDSPQREMTLPEVIHRLPPTHRARQEYESLIRFNRTMKTTIVIGLVYNIGLVFLVSFYIWRWLH